MGGTHLYTARTYWVPIVDKNGWWKAKEKKENHLRLILGIKGTVPMSMGRTQRSWEEGWQEQKEPNNQGS